MVTDNTPLVERADEYGWLVEENFGGGIIHWIALTDKLWERDLDDILITRLNPVRRVKDANNALRFARKGDAEAFIKLFDRHLLHAVATEHCWPAASLPTIEQIDKLRENADRAVRITVWNFLRNRGVKQDDCYAIIEGASADFRAALPASPVEEGGVPHLSPFTDNTHYCGIIQVDPADFPKPPKGEK